MHYSGPVIRPPHEAYSILLETTVGCSHDGCTFCTFYKGCRFRMAPIGQMEADLREAKSALPHAEHVWLAGGDPFTVPVKFLEQWADLVHRYFPGASISTYARIDSTFKKSVDDLKRLRSMGYNDLVIGIESGWGEVLEHVNKGYTAADILRECRKLEEAGIEYRVIYLSGLAGEGKGQQNARITAELLNQLKPTFMCLTSVTVVPDSELYEEVLAGMFREASEIDRIREFRTLIGALENPIEIDARSISNPISFTADLPRHREGVLRELDSVISSWSSRDEGIRRGRRERQRTI